MSLPEFGTPSKKTLKAMRKIWEDFEKEEQKRRNQPLTGGVVFCNCPNCRGMKGSIAGEARAIR